MDREKWEAARQRARNDLALASTTPEQARELLRQAEIAERMASSRMQDICAEPHEAVDHDHSRRHREARMVRDVASETAARVGRLVTAANFAETKFEDRMAWWGDCPITGGDVWAAARPWLKD